VARATGYSQATSVVSVGQPRLQTSTPTITLYVGERPPNVTVSTLDQSGQTRIVATPLVIAGTASDTTVARPDSASRTVAARQATTSFALRPRRKGSVDVVYTATGYTPDTTVVTVDTAKLDLQNPPNGLGPGQVATTTMYVQLPYTTDSALVVSLSSTNPGVLTVPAQATIPAGSYYTYFNVTGTGVGVAAVIVTAPHSYPDTLAVRISRPRLAVTLTTAANAGQRYTFTIAARDSLNIQRVLAAPLTVTLASSTPGRTQFDSLTTTIAAGQSSVTMGVSFDTAGTYVVTASAAGYDAGADTTAVTGALVRMVSGNLFAPQTVTIPAGRVITWRNDDAVSHTTTADGASPLWNSGTRTPGQTYQRTFSTAGTFTYHCTIHAGMTGTIVVQ
jgi:plastocyanin